MAPLLAEIIIKQWIFGILLFLTSLFLILLVLVQRGRGGGLAGALGGMGGQSAFGTKAGDVFTRITIVRGHLLDSARALAAVVFACPKEVAFGARGGAEGNGPGRRTTTDRGGGHSADEEAGAAAAATLAPRREAEPRPIRSSRVTVTQGESSACC